jgi:hypothetical protein
MLSGFRGAIWLLAYHFNVVTDIKEQNSERINLEVAKDRQFMNPWVDYQKFQKVPFS